MKRRTHVFLVAVDEDAMPGFFHSERINDDFIRLLQNSIPHYNPLAIHLGYEIRESNFVNQVKMNYKLPVVDVTFTYPAERSPEETL